MTIRTKLAVPRPNDFLDNPVINGNRTVQPVLIRDVTEDQQATSSISTSVSVTNKGHPGEFLIALVGQRGTGEAPATSLSRDGQTLTRYTFWDSGDNVVSVFRVASPNSGTNTLTSTGGTFSNWSLTAFVVSYCGGLNGIYHGNQADFTGQFDGDQYGMYVGLCAGYSGGVRFTDPWDKGKAIGSSDYAWKIPVDARTLMSENLLQILGVGTYAMIALKALGTEFT